MLAGADPTPRLRDWGDALHDQYALPFFLRQDLCAVFDDLAAHALRLGDRLCSELLHDPCKPRWHTVRAGCELALGSAIEFWPLVGDVASQEADDSRLVDSSTLRLHRPAPFPIFRAQGDRDGITPATETRTDTVSPPR